LPADAYAELLYITRPLLIVVVNPILDRYVFDSTRTRPKTTQAVMYL
jgi:hypothetical protein